MLAQSETTLAPGIPETQSLRAARAKLEESTKELKADVEAKKAMLKRLTAYVLPQLTDSNLSNSNLLGILAAQKTARDDLSRMTVASSRCDSCAAQSDTDNIMSCITGCASRTMPDLPVIQRKVKSCQAIDWLPF